MQLQNDRPPLRECCMNTTANANLFSRLFDGLDDPLRLAIEMLDGARISYGDLIARAGRMANVLVSRGVKAGDRVAAQTEKSVPGLILYLAAVRAGSSSASNRRENRLALAVVFMQHFHRAVDLTFATEYPRVLVANVKSKSAREV